MKKHIGNERRLMKCWEQKQNGISRTKSSVKMKSSAARKVGWLL